MKLLQLNVTANWGSTGKIAEGIGQAAMKRGWESVIAYGRHMNPSDSELIKVGNRADVLAHYAKDRLLDGEGLGSHRATRSFIKQIRDYAPDIVHLHNIHDHWMNYPLLMDYLADSGTPVVWTFHDCWAFTGGCAHFVESGCTQWKTQCVKCPVRRRIFGREERNQQMHISYFSKPGRRLHIVSVSAWLDGLVSESRLGKFDHSCIYNGVDCRVFTPKDATSLLKKHNLRGKKILLGVSSVWPKSKGLDDYIRLSRLLDDSFRIVLVGLPKALDDGLPANIIPVERTQSAEELAEWYSAATAVLSLSKAETFGLTLAEGLACGTPSIAYEATALKEILHPDTGLGVPPGSIPELRDAVYSLASHPERFSPDACRQRALTEFNKEVQFDKYPDLYERILH